MKRLLTNLVVVALFWPALAVAVVAVTGPDEPACCRRDTHHCHADHSQGDGFQAFTHPCPCCQSLPVSSQIAPTTFVRTAPVMTSLPHLAARLEIRPDTGVVSDSSVRGPPRTASI